MRKMTITAGAILTIWQLIACASKTASNASVEIGTFRFSIPSAYVAPDGSVPHTLGDLSQLDRTQGVILEVPLRDLNISGPSSVPEDRKWVLVQLLEARNVSTIPAYVGDAWRRRGMYESQIVEDDLSGRYSRIYASVTYPSLWHEFRGDVRDRDVRGDAGDRWIATCRGAPGERRTSLNQAQCTTFSRWNDVLVQISFSGLLIENSDAVKTGILQLLDTWHVKSARLTSAG